MKRHGSMNRIYRLVWSKVVNTWVVVAENAKRRGKSVSGHRRITAMLTLMMLTVPLAQAAPSGGQIVTGTGSISQSGSTTTIAQASPNLSLNWQSFNIAPAETVNFQQPSASAIAVNHILDTNGTQILGHLNANGQIYLINPNGILFGQGAQVNVGGLVASTLDMNDASLNANARAFSGNGSGSIINQGAITTANGGYVALLGNHVENQGTIVAQLGSVALGAGNSATLTFSGNSLVKMQIDQSVLSSVANNGGLIKADGGMVVMTAGAENALLASVVNNTGVIEAHTAVNHNGTITLQGGMTAGTVNIAGTLDASSIGAGNGGLIQTSAAQVNIADGAIITTAAPTGLAGIWRINSTGFNIAASGGNVTGTALSTSLGAGNVSIMNNSGAGDINVNDTVAWNSNTLTLNSQHNININTAMNGSGTASLALQYGQGAVATGNTSSYNVNAPVNLPSGKHFSTKLGSDGANVNYTVITSLGAAGSTTGTDLQGMNGNLSGNYALGSNIDASATAGWNAGAGFMPLGLNGMFDGLGHTISNLTINRPTQNSVGLFSYTLPGSGIRNVGLVGGSVKGNNSVGGLVGYHLGAIDNSYTTGNVDGISRVGGLVGDNSGTISNSYATGNVSGTTDVGGLVGYNLISINNSYATGNVQGTDFVGGLAGYNAGSIRTSHATGSISGTSNVGGLVGQNQSNTLINTNAKIGDSYATGSVSGMTSIGGLVGDNSGMINASYATGAVSNGINSYDAGGLVGYNSGTISNSYATGAVSGGDNDYGAGGLVGGNSGMINASYATGAVSNGINSYGAGGLVGYNIGTISNSYASSNVSGPVDVGGLVGYNANTIVNSHYNVDTVTINGNHALTLGGLYDAQYQDWINHGMSLDIANYSNSLVYDNGYYLISNVQGIKDLLGFADNPAYQFRLNNNIDLSGAPGLWIPSFSGAVFDGAGHTINNLNLDLPYASNVGMFGSLSNSSTIENLGITNGNVIGLDGVGGLAGYSLGTINNSYATENVTASNNYNSQFFYGASAAGGLVGYNDGTINNSYSTGNVTISSNFNSNYNFQYYWDGAGGLVGYNNGTISNSYATGNVTVSSNFNSNYTFQYYWDAAGGLIGYNNGTINNSYATGNVQGSSYVGGLVGQNTGTLDSNYATGSVSGTSYVGGLAGSNSATISNSYASGNVTGTSSAYIDNFGGLVGFSSGTVINSYATGIVTGGVNNFEVGGLIGDNHGTIGNSYATGSVSGTSDIGGLVGANIGAISNSYATGSASGTVDVGGLVGWNDIPFFAGGTITNSYSVGSVSGTTNVGGLVGQDGGTVSNSYWDTLTSGQSTSAGGTGLTTAQMMSASNFTGFNFTTTPSATGNNWVIVDANGTLNNAGGAAGATYPMLASEYSTSIVNSHQLQLMAMNLDANYTLAANIDASTTGNGKDVWGSGGFVPVGNSTANFTGTFDGMNHTISNLTIDRPTQNNIGLFGVTGTNSVIANVGLLDGSISGNDFVGALIGWKRGTVSNSYYSGSVKGSRYVGGLVGYNFGMPLIEPVPEIMANLESNTLSFQSNRPPESLNPSPTLIENHISGEKEFSAPPHGPGTTTMNTGVLGSPLYIVDGGLKLPDYMHNTNE